jgi:hypothetical protein
MLVQPLRRAPPRAAASAAGRQRYSLSFGLKALAGMAAMIVLLSLKVRPAG